MATTKIKTDDDIAKQIKVISEEIKQLKAVAKPKLEEKVSEIGSNVRHFIDASKANANETVELASETIKKNPLRNTAIAFAAGAFIAALLNRK